MSNPLTKFISSIFGKNQLPVSGTPGIDGNTIEAYNKTRNGKNHVGLCHAPFANMYISQDGEIKACCHNMEFSIGKYPEQTLKEIWHSDKANEFREHMRNNSWQGGCSVCVADMKTGNFGEVRARHFDSLPVNTEFPTMMEFLLTNTCNLECVMCKGEFSSLIRKNREGLPPIRHPFDKAFLDQLDEFLPHLKETRFSGSGEAFSIDMNYEIWDKLIKTNPECLIMVQTNGTILTGRVKEVLAKGKFQIGVSLDSLKKEVFEAIRINANHTKVMENIKYFHEYCKTRGTRFNISTCVMRQNWSELPGFINFCNDLGCVATFHKVWYPRRYGLHTLPSNELQVIHSYLASFDFPSETAMQITNRNHYHYFTSVVKEWLQEATEREDKLNQDNALTTDDLITIIQGKWQGYADINGMSMVAKVTSINEYLDKLLQVVNRFDDPVHKTQILRMVNAMEPEMILANLDKHSVDFLYRQSSQSLLDEFAL